MAFNIIPNDLLFEILLRLPDARAAVHASLVSKRWHSLIAGTYFRQRFTEHHRNKEYSDFSFFVKCSSRYQVPYYKLQGRSNPKPYDLSFIAAKNLEIKAASGDLLLVAQIDDPLNYKGVRQYHICNTLTGRWLSLPLIPPVSDYRPNVYFFNFYGGFGWALVRDPTLRVFVVSESRYVDGKFTFRTAMYDSATATWNLPLDFYFPYPMPEVRGWPDIPLGIVLAGDGTLYWLDGVHELHGIFAFHPFTFEFRVFQVPTGEFTGITAVAVKDKVRLGVVRGRLRLSRMLKLDDRHVGLRIWEKMEGKDDTWWSVHDVVIEAAWDQDDTLFFMLGFDPSDGDSIFMVREKEIYRYRIDQASYERISEFPMDCFGGGAESVQKMKREVSKHLRFSTLVHPLWPTPHLLGPNLFI